MSIDPGHNDGSGADGLVALALGRRFLSPSNGPFHEIRILTSSRWSLRNHRLARVLDEGQPTVPRPLEITGWRERDALRHHCASATSGAATVEDSRSHLR